MAEDGTFDDGDETVPDEPARDGGPHGDPARGGGPDAPDETTGEGTPEDLWARLREQELGTPTAERVPDGTRTGSHTETHIIIRETEDTPAIRQLRTWVARRTRTQMVAVAIASLLALGPLLAMVMTLRDDSGPVNELLAVENGEDRAVTTVTATMTSLSPNQGEMRARVNVRPAVDLLDEEGRLLETVTVSVNDTFTELRAGDTVRPFDVTVAIADGSITRYPFDRYRGQLTTYLSTGSGEEREFLGFQTIVRSVVGDFSVSATARHDVDAGPQIVGGVDWEAARPATTTVYAIWLMVLMWGLSVTGLMLVWAVILWIVDIPMWVFGYFVGVLFALPPLRDSLPGRPPPGTLFDFLSFYWSVTIIGVNLLIMLAIWLTRTREEYRLKMLDARTNDANDTTGSTPRV